MKFKLVKATDLIIIGILVAVCLVLLLPKFFSTESLSATVLRDGEVIEQIDLSKVENEYEIKLDGVTILVEKNAISFIQADCKDKLCIKCGKLTRNGDTAVCLPTRTVVTLSGNGEKQVDAVSY